MTKLEILQMYIDDLNSQVTQSPARDNRIAMLIDERNKAINYSQCCKSDSGQLCDECKTNKTETITLCKDCYLKDSEI